MSRRGLLVACSCAAWLGSFLVARATGSWAVFVVAAIVMSGLWFLLDEATGKSLGVRASSLLAGAAAGVLQVAVTLALWPLVASSIPTAAAEVSALYGLMGGWSVPRTAQVALISMVAVSEEIAFRGSLLRPAGREAGWRRPTLRDGLNVLLLAAVYAAAQASSGNVTLMVTAFLVGLYWGALRSVTGSIAAAATAHVLWDLALIVVWPLA